MPHRATLIRKILALTCLTSPGQARLHQAFPRQAALTQMSMGGARPKGWGERPLRAAAPARLSRRQRAVPPHLHALRRSQIPLQPLSHHVSGRVVDLRRQRPRLRSRPPLRLALADLRPALLNQVQHHRKRHKRHPPQLRMRARQRHDVARLTPQLGPAPRRIAAERIARVDQVDPPLTDPRASARKCVGASAIAA